MLETKKEQLEVKILISEDPNVTNFDHQKKSLIFDCTNETTQEVRTLITDVLSDSTKEQIESITPFIQDVLSLQEIQNVSYDKENEKESLELYKKFDALTAAKRVDETFEPIYRLAKLRVDNINGIKKAFKDELKSKKLLLQDNFKEYLDEKARKKAEADAKKRAKDEAEINALKASNQEAQEKALQLEKEKHIADCRAKINAIQTSALSNIPFANIDGLGNLKFNIADTMFESLMPPKEAGLEKEIISALEREFETARINAINAIDDRVKALTLEQKNNELQQQVPSSLDNQPEPTFHNPSYIKNEDKTDLELLSDYNKRIQEYTLTIKKLNENLDYDLKVLINNVKDKGLQGYMNNFPQKSLPTINEWMDKTSSWSLKLKTQFEKHLSK